MKDASPLETGLNTEVRNLLAKATAGEKVTADGTWFTGAGAEAETTRPYNIDDLIRLRQSVRKVADKYQKGDANARALRQLLESVDDTIEQLVKSSGDGVLIAEHQKLRADFRQKEAIIDRIWGNGEIDITELLKDATLVDGKSRLDGLIATIGPDEVKKTGKYAARQ